MGGIEQILLYGQYIEILYRCIIRQHMYVCIGGASTLHASTLHGVEKRIYITEKQIGPQGGWHFVAYAAVCELSFLFSV